MDIYIHDPNDKLEYGVNWEDELTPRLLTIASSAWILPAGVTEVSSGNTDTAASIVLTTPDATPGDEFTITNRIVMSDGQQSDHSFILKVRER